MRRVGHSIAALTAEKSKLSEQNAGYQETIAELEREIARLTAELQRQRQGLSLRQSLAEEMAEEEPAVQAPVVSPPPKPQKPEPPAKPAVAVRPPSDALEKMRKSKQSARTLLGKLDLGNGTITLKRGQLQGLLSSLSSSTINESESSEPPAQLLEKSVSNPELEALAAIEE
jgi:hypothetical protein